MSVFGVWMWPGSVRTHGAQQIAAQCRRAGITDIFFLTKGLSGTVSCRSSIAPQDCERDLLGELLDAAHAQGIRVHAWFTSASDASYKALHPESGRFHYHRGRDQGLISLTDEGYLAYMEQVVGDICKRYPIDGLHLDYIRYNHLIYGWSPEDLARYAKEGADISELRALMDRAFPSDGPHAPDCLFDAYRAGNESVLALARARRKDVVRFAKRLIAAARAEKPALFLSAALMPEGAYEDIAFSDLHYGQNYEDAAGLYDAVLPMAYSKAYEKDGGWVRAVAEGTLKRGHRTIMGLHAYAGGTFDSLRADLAALGGSGIDGVCLFRYGAYVPVYAQEESITVYNALEQPVTRIEAACGGETISLCEAIAPGEEKQFALPFVPDAVRAFSAEEEICTHLIRFIP